MRHTDGNKLACGGISVNANTLTYASEVHYVINDSMNHCDIELCLELFTPIYIFLNKEILNGLRHA